MGGRVPPRPPYNLSTGYSYSCLISNKSDAVLKKYNLCCHCDTKHLQNIRIVERDGLAVSSA